MYLIESALLAHRSIGHRLQVFPKIDLVVDGAQEGGGGASQGRSRITNPSSPEYMAAVCTFETFQEMVQEKVRVEIPRKRNLRQDWFQKGCKSISPCTLLLRQSRARSNAVPIALDQWVSTSGVSLFPRSLP